MQFYVCACSEKRERTREARRERSEKREERDYILFCYNVGRSTSYVAEKAARLCVKKSGWLDGAKKKSGRLDGAKKCTVRSS